MKTQFQNLAAAFAFFALTGTALHAQLPKVKVPAVKAPTTNDVAGKVSDKAEDAGGDVAQTTEKLQFREKSWGEKMAGADWKSADFIDKIGYELHYYAGEVATAQAGNPGQKAVGDKYLVKFKEHLTEYQTNVALESQKLHIPIKDETKREAAELMFNQGVYYYRKLLKAETTHTWDDQSWVNGYKADCDSLALKIQKYRALDADNYGKIERYETPQKAYAQTWESRKHLPARKAKSEEFFSKRSGAFSYVRNAPKDSYKDDVKFLASVKECEWNAAREEVKFLDEWKFKLYGENQTHKEMVTTYNSSNFASLKKAIDDATGLANSQKYGYQQWVSATRVNNLSEAASLIDPADSWATGAAASGKTLLDAKTKKYEAETFTSAYHKANVGKVAFSASATVGSSFAPITTVKAGSPFTIVLFFDRPVALLAPDGKFRFNVAYEDNQEDPEAVDLTITGADLDKSYLAYTVFGENPNYADPEEAESQEYCLQEVIQYAGKTGKFYVSASAFRVGTMELSSTALTFDGTDAAAVAKMKAKWELLRNTRLADVRMPAAHHADATLQAKMKTVYEAQWKDCKVQNLRITSDWAVVRNELTGIIIARVIDAAVAFQYKDGTCRWEYVQFKQDAQGGGTYGETYFNGTGDGGEIACPNVNK
jgi:hypothetical protein